MKILRSPDVSDPFDVASGEVDTSFPRLNPRVYRMTIRDPEVAESKNKPGAFLLVMKLETTEEAKDTRGEVLHKGFKFTHRVSITASEKRDNEAIKRDLATILQCALGDASKGMKIRAFLDNPKIIDGKIVDVKVGLQKETDEFPESNTARFIPPQ